MEQPRDKRNTKSESQINEAFLISGCVFDPVRLLQAPVLLAAHLVLSSYICADPVSQQKKDIFIIIK